MFCIISDTCINRNEIIVVNEVYANDGAEIEAINAVADMQRNGINARFCVLETLEEAKAFAEKMGIDKVQIIG